MKTPRASWIVLFATIALTAALPSLREQVRGADPARVMYQQLAVHRHPSRTQDPLAPYRRQAVDFVEQRYPNDVDMLVAAGRLSASAELGLSRLYRATQLGRSPVASAVYVARLLEIGPRFTRLGLLVADPADPKQVAQAKRQLQEQLRETRRPERLSAGEMALTLDGLHRWEAVDPENGLPYALEAYCLYGMQRDAEAERAWERAGQLPQARDHRWQVSVLRARLLHRMGMVQADATYFSISELAPWAGGFVQAMARCAWYEGRVAQLEGREQEALRWWGSTIALGRHLQECAETVDGFLVGQQISEIGAGPLWQLHRDPALPATGRAFNNGRLYYGPAHALYVSQVGAKADADMREGLLQARARYALLADQRGPLSSARPLHRALALQIAAGAAARVGAWCLGGFVLVSLLARRAADRAARPGKAWPLLAAALTLVPALGGAVWDVRLHPQIAVVRTLADLVSGLALLASLALALLIARAAAHTRPEEVAFAAAWRENLRRALPVTIAAAALVFLGLGLASAKLRADWLHVWGKPGATEVSVLVSRLGPQWQHPTIPSGLWVPSAPSDAVRRQP